MAWIVDQQGDHVVRVWIAVHHQYPVAAACTCGKTWRNYSEHHIAEQARAHCATVATAITTTTATTKG